MQRLTPPACRVLFISGLLCSLWSLALVRVRAADLPTAAQADGKAAKPKPSHEPRLTEPKVPEKIRQAMQDRNYAAAVVALNEALEAKPPEGDYLTYLKGRALHLQQKYDAAAAAFDAVEKNFPNSVWARRARFGKALSMMRKGDFEAAELIYRKEVEYLLSQDRKQEIADIYLEFAASYFQPADPLVQPNYQKALEFYQQALLVGPKPDSRAEIELQVARCFQLLGNHKEAAARFAAFVKDHPGHKLEIEAQFRLGEAQLALGQTVAARRTWQDLLAAHADSKSERLAEASFNLSQTYGLPNPGSNEDLALGVASLETFLRQYPAHKLAGAANLRIAQSYFNRGRYEDAVKSLQRFLADPKYADREEVPDARQLLGLAYQRQKKYPEALAAWQEYLSKHPAHHAWSDVQREIVNTEFLIGQEKRETKQYDAAHKVWAEFLQKYPLDPRDPAILLAFGQMDFAQEEYDAAIAAWKRLAATYPTAPEAGEGQVLIAQTLESKLGKLDAALEAYKKVTMPNAQSVAVQAIRRLTAKSLSIATERIFRTNETPKVKVVTRNLDCVTVRIYKVNLETYFRKMHLASGVESLDIALIDPDKTFEFAIPKYADYERFENEIDVPLPRAAGEKETAAGVLAVTVSSKTLEATTMIIRSDLDLIAKSSRDELFVFAENMRTGRPWPKAHLLLSNGKQIFAEADTDDHGVFQQSYKELKDAGDLRVFAIADGNSASNVVGLNGLNVAQGLTEKGYLFTERPAYRAGQMVHFRGIVRQVEHDNYIIPKDRKFTVEVFDVRNRLVWQQDQTLSELGTVHANFVLPPTAPVGQYRILMHDLNNHSYQGSFSVHEYQLDPVQLSVNVDRKIYYRGESIEGKIVAKFYYGAPLADREVRYQLADGPVETAKTDANGEIPFKLPTRDFRETQVVPLHVSLPERNLQTTQNFFIATQGFSVSLSTVRPVFVSGESFEVTVKAADAEGKPLKQKLTMTVEEQTTIDGKVGEKEVDKFEVTTDAKEGVARKTLKLAKGGTYLLRVEGIDRFENPVSGETQIQISDDSDRVRLRILADKHTFHVGDTADVVLHWREAPALALVTLQGAKILDYKLVDLKTGENKLAIPMAAKLAPNFDLEVNVMTDTRPDPKDKKLPIVRFHEANSPFFVQRELNVALETRRKDHQPGEIRPGDDIEVVVKTTDPQGQPIAAEVSVAMIEQALLDRFGSPLPPIDEFFRGAPRVAAVRSASSVTFSYHPRTRPINSRLLAEAERVEIAKEEAARMAAGGEQLGMDMSGPTDLAVEFGEQGGGVPYATPPQSGAGQQNPVQGSLSYNGYNGGQGQNTLANQQAINDPAGYSPEQLNIQGQLRQGNGAKPNAGMPGLNRYLGSGGPGNGNGADWRAQGMQTPALIVQSDSTVQSANEAFQNGDRPGALTNLYSGVVGQAGATLQNGGNFNGNTLAVNPSNITNFYNSGQRDVIVCLSDGTQFNVNFQNRLGGKTEGAQVQKLADELNRSGALLLPSVGSQETGYWNPSVFTDKKGVATLTLTVPEDSTAWRFLAKGVTAETLVGEASSELKVKKELFGEMRLPAAFTDGDEAEITVAVHNQLLDHGTIAVTLKTTIGGKSTEEQKSLQVAKKGIEELSFKMAIHRPENQTASTDPEIGATFELTVSGGDQAKTVDHVRRSIPIRPYGLPVFAATGGTATGDMTAWIEGPKDLPLTAPGLQILIGPTVEKSLLDIVLEPGPWCQLEAARVASELDVSTGDLMASLALQKLIGATRDANNPQGVALDARIRASVSQLVSSQQDDGGWSWTGRGKESQRFPSARAVWALNLAKQAGYSVSDDALAKAETYLQSQISKSAETDYETKAILLHSLAAAGQGDFTLANRLYRSRTALSNGALLHLILAFAEMDRKPMAKELLALLKDRNLDDAVTRRMAALGSLPWSDSATELHALYALALETVTPDAAATKDQIDWLMAHRTGHRWSPEKATGPAAQAVCAWFAKSRFDQQHYTLTVFVNDNQVKAIDIDKDTGALTLDVPAKFLNKGKQRINFQVAGRGRYTFECIYGGFVAADQLKSTTKDWYVTRHYEPAPLEVDGKEVPRGFGILQGSYASFRNPLTQLPVGKRGQVQLEMSRALPGNTPEDQIEYLVVTEPLPAGTTVIENSIHGGFERYEINPGSITFYIGSRTHIEPIQFDVYGYTPGVYKVGPTVLRNAYRPDQLAVSATRTLTVLPLGSKSADEYQLTPQELFELGKIEFAKHDDAAAGQHLSTLLAKWNVEPNVYKNVAQLMLDIRLKTGPAKEIVRYFEIIKEKWPDSEIPFEKITKVAAAYHELGEYERSFLVFRATLESSFERESNVAGFLDSQGEFLRSTDVMSRLLIEYPPEPYVAAATYALAQRVYAKAPQAAADPKLREKKINRVDLVQRALGMLDHFLIAYPEDPAADQASFSMANALLELKAYKEAIARCEKFAQRYPHSEFLDSFWYVIGYSHFALGDHEQALEMCRKVAEHKRIEKGSGREIESPNRWAAIYILGQVYHSLGEAAKAIAEYSQVEDRFSDAKEAIEYFAHKAISLPEVSTIKPGEKAEVELKFRNLAAIDVKVYRIDLMKFSLLKRNLSGITQINLAGINPQIEKTVELGDGKDYRDRTKKLDLPLKDEGAYLVVVRGGDLFASGLVLVSPLTLEVQEDSQSGEVRTTVKDSTKDKYVNDVHVKVIGSLNHDFTAGATDLRGVFTAEAIRGTSTVIAQADNSRYAFFRGSTVLGPPAAQPNAAAATPAAKPQQPLGNGLLDNLNKDNNDIQKQQSDWLKQLQNNKRGGVDAKAAY
ncbi:MAG TPA: tetratricopeptide repeat protein [Pirellulales bacterium]|nr:tetratricopeptide repeat protein [Pirellulales bacterium]